MSDAMTCDDCGAIHYDGDKYYCPNADCLSVTGEMVVKSFDESDFPSRLGDAVKEPNHYQMFGTVEVIDMIKGLLTEEEFRGYLCGSVLKYRLRAGKKDNTLQDIAKALRYEQWLKEGIKGD